MIYFETVGVVAGSMWDKSISLSPYEARPFRCIAEIILRWKAADPSAPTKVRIFGIDNKPIECEAKELLSRDYLENEYPRP
jgi:hypothetical protein